MRYCTFCCGVFPFVCVRAASSLAALASLRGSSGHICRPHKHTQRMWERKCSGRRRSKASCSACQWQWNGVLRSAMLLFPAENERRSTRSLQHSSRIAHLIAAERCCGRPHGTNRDALARSGHSPAVGIRVEQKPKIGEEKATKQVTMKHQTSSRDQKRNVMPRSIDLISSLECCSGVIQALL